MHHPRPVGLKIGTHIRTDPDGAPFDAPALSIHRLGLLELSVRIGKGGSQIGLEGGLVPLDDKERRGLLGAQQAPQLAVRVQSIKRADASANGQSGKQFTGSGDLVGFFAHYQLSPDFLTLMGETGKQMRRISFSCPGSSHRFAIDGERIGGRGLASGPDPCREHLLDDLGVDLRK